jgi:hypothetical protein
MGEVLQALHDIGLLIQVEKCMWGVPELEYLCHKILAASMLPLPSWGWSTSTEVPAPHRSHAAITHRQAAQRQEEA